MLGIKDSKGVVVADLDNLEVNLVRGDKSSDLKLFIGNIKGRGGTLGWGDVGC